MKRRNKWLLAGVIFLLLLGGIIYGGSSYLFNYAFARSPYSGQPAAKKARQLKVDQEWLKSVKTDKWHQQAVDSNIKLTALYLPAARHSNKTVVVAHGYKENYQRMASYIRFFHKAGFNVLAPDDRGAGESGGRYQTFGWLDRLDYAKWCRKIVQNSGPKVKIGLFGVSMGGATVMMTSGEKLPSQVKAVVEDCGYTSVGAELGTQLKAQFKLPEEPLLTTASWIGDSKVGFDFKKASAVKQLRNNRLPVLFIHGGKDKFVPTNMVYQNYKATAGPRQLWVVKQASHAMSYYEEPAAYQHKVLNFFDKYMN